MSGGITGLPCYGRNKYRNLALQVGGVSKRDNKICSSVLRNMDQKKAVLAIPSKN
jgi:hypothetical protein